MNFWGRNSLILLCTHTALGFKRIALNGWAYAANIPDHPGKEYIVECIFVLIILMLMMYGVIAFTNRYLPFLLRFPSGRKRADTQA